MPKDDGVEDALRVVISAAFEELRHEPDFDTVFQQESLKAIEAAQATGFDRVVKLLERAEEERSAILRNVSLGQIDTAEYLADLQDSYRSLKNDYGTIAKALQDLRSLKRRDLEYISLKFGIPISRDPSDDQVVAAIADSASDFLARSEQAGKRTTTPQIADLKAQAAVARADLQFIEADRFFAEVAAIEKEIADETLARAEAAKETARGAIEDYAGTLEDQASNALDANRPEDAFALFFAAAESIKTFDLFEAVRRCTHAYSEAIIRHGVRFGGVGLPLGGQMAEILLTETVMNEAPDLYAAGKNHKGIALLNQGIYAAEQEGVRLLGEAATAFREALAVRTKDRRPLEWARSHCNLGNALQMQGARTAGEDGKPLLAEAIRNYRETLNIWIMFDKRGYWADTQNNLGAALQKQGILTEGDLGAGLLAEAVNAYRAALSVHTKADYPVAWAKAKNNLGTALHDQGTRTAGEDGIQLLAEAVAEYDHALTVRTNETYPVDWAMTQENLAHTEKAIADHDTTTDPRPHLEAALAHVEAALTVYDPEHMSHHFEKATLLRDHLKARLADLD